MQSNTNLIHQLYAAFAARDGATMAACYLPGATFSDPIYPSLEGGQIETMWTMLCLQAQSLEIAVTNIQTEADSGSADWTAHYTFGHPPRAVFNQIHAEFKFRDGLILEHHDQFSFWKWSRMALGPLGLLLGWNKQVREQIRQQAQRNLIKFTAAAKIR